MTSLAPNETVVMEGSFVYDGTIECDIRIVHSPIRYGSGDYEDPPEIADDVQCDTYYVQYGSTTARGVFTSGGMGFPSLSEAMTSAESVAGPGPTVRWKQAVRFNCPSP